MTIGKRIRAARLRADLNQSEMARRLGIKPQAVQSWERDKKPVTPKPARIPSIARVLGVTESYLYDTEAAASGKPDPDQFGVGTPVKQLLQRIAGAAPRLTPKELEVLRAFIDVLLRIEGDGTGESSDPRGGER